MPKPSERFQAPIIDTERDSEQTKAHFRLRQLLGKIRELLQPEGAIQTDYEQLKPSIDTIPAYLDRVRQSQQEDLAHANYHLVFYLNSSDSLTTLTERLNQTGRRIMTVAGSGEFAHAFIKNGAAEIYSFDISPAAAFNAELRHVALCSLSMEEYISLFGTWIKGWTTDGDNYPIYDHEAYLKIKNKLSSEAQLYFDLLFEEPELITFHRKSSLRGFARARTNPRYRYNRFIGDIITTEAEYKELQKKARKVKFTQILCNAMNMSELIASIQPDQIYQSNVGFTLDRVVRIAHNNSEKGSEVICTVGLGTEVLHQENDTYYYQDRRIEVGDEITYEMEDENSNTVKVPIKIIGLDSSAKFGVTIKIN